MENMNKKFISCVNKNIKILNRINNNYSLNLKKLNIDEIKNIDDFRKLPFMTRETLNKCIFKTYDKFIRIHSTSGTTSTPLIIPYTRKDITDWTNMMCRCFKIIGLTKQDIIQISVGYGLWTAGVGFQLGCEKLLATAVPVGCDNTEKQLYYLKTMKCTALCATSSYGLYLAEKFQNESLFLKKGIFGSESWNNKTRKIIEEKLKIKTYDIYGMTEAYGPGIAISCNKSNYMHYFDDYFYFEIIDPDTCEVLRDGEYGELVITTLSKRGLPLLRYRTHDITRIIKEKCSCGNNYPRIDRIVGRTDDLIKFHGVKVYPSQFACIIDEMKELSSEYLIKLESKNGKDYLTLECEIYDGYEKELAERQLLNLVKVRIGININVVLKNYMELNRTTGKTKRVIDLRNK